MHSKHGPATDLKVTPIYVELTPEGETLVNENISTLGEIKNLVTETGADISLVDSINRQVFYLSDEAIMNALVPLVNASKQYLYEQGLSENDIQEILEENDADEIVLTPLVITLTEFDQQQQQAALLDFDRKVSIVDPNIDWEKVFNCAIAAFGGDILAALTQSNAKKWTKRIILGLIRT